MAYRGIKGPDPFTSKTTRNERFAQMSKQEQLIEQKKREIQAKLEEQKKKEADEAMKKLQGVSGSSKTASSSKTGSSSGSQSKSAKKQFWKSNHDHRWKKDIHTDAGSTVQKNNSMNIFSNDGSFLDQFKKLSGSKDPKVKKEDTANNTETKDPISPGSDSVSAEKWVGERSERWERQERQRSGGSRENWQSRRNRPSSPYSPTRASSPPVPGHYPQMPAQLQQSPHSQIPVPPMTLPQCVNQAEPLPPVTQAPLPSLIPADSTTPLILPPPPHTLSSTTPAPVSTTPSIPVAPSVPPPGLVLSQPPPLAPQFIQYSPLSSVTLHTLPQPATVSVPPPPPVLVPPPQLVPLQQPPPQAPMPHLVSAAPPPQTGVSPAAVPTQPPPSAEESMREVAKMVAQCGDDIEEIMKARNPDDQSIWFLHDKNDAAYMQYRCLVDQFKAELEEQKRESTQTEENVDPIGNIGTANVKQEPENAECTKETEVKQEQADDENSRNSEGKRSGDESDGGRRRKKRRSRWAPESEKVEIAPPVNTALTGSSTLLTKVTRTNPALIQYAVQAFGTSNLSEEDWKKAEDHYKINLLYQDMLRKRQELDRLARSGKFKYEYDSDEETDGGTWEHRLRMAEMEATQLWADELTKKAEGKHHIGDFLPPDELERFMEKFQALREGREPDLSDYKEYKLKEDNIGFQMLQKLGWTEGQGLGADGSGIVDPVNKAPTRPANQGMGLERPEDVSRGDDEYDAYRKRMMLAYRFRPNPLNNPRRPYY